MMTILGIRQQPQVRFPGPEIGARFHSFCPSIGSTGWTHWWTASCLRCKSRAFERTFQDPKSPHSVTNLKMTWVVLSSSSGGPNVSSPQNKDGALSSLRHAAVPPPLCLQESRFLSVYWSVTQICR